MNAALRLALSALVTNFHFQQTLATEGADCDDGVDGCFSEYDPTVSMLQTKLNLEMALNQGKRSGPFEDGTTFAARGITLTIEATKVSFRHGAPFPVTVTVENGGSRSYVMMKWESPFEEELVGNFFVSSLPSEYLGRVMERWTAPLTAENSALLPAGGSISANFDLGQYLSFLRTGESSVSLDYDFMFFELEAQQHLWTTLCFSWAQRQTRSTRLRRI